MTGDQYLQNILAREAVNTGPFSPVLTVATTLRPIIQTWSSGMLLSMEPSGSFAKGTANMSGTDIDLFISLSERTTDTLKDIYESLAKKMAANGYTPRRQNVSINVKVGAFDVDLVPGKRQNSYGTEHSLYRRKADTWTKTDVTKHIAHVRAAGRLAETRVLKLWRNQKGIDFPSFYLELTIIDALRGQNSASLADRVFAVFRYLRDSFATARVVDPANTNNIISEDLSVADKAKVKLFAVQALGAKTWEEIVK